MDDRIQDIHKIFFGLNIAALFTGLTLGGNIEVSLNLILLLLIMISLRVKFWLDDVAYFEDVKNDKLPGGLPFSFGFALAMVSWVIFMFAAYFVKRFEVASLLMAIFFLPSTMWIIAAMVKKGAYAEQVPWLFFNFFYAVGFTFLFARRMSWNPFVNSIDNFATGVLIILLIVFLFDLVVTRILEKHRRV
jgi:hypothetical protein